jgi:hypothetical protein
MSLPFLDDDADGPAEFRVALLHDSRVCIESRVKAAAKVQERHAGLGQRREIVERRCLRREAAQDGILTVDAGNFVGILDGPGGLRLMISITAPRRPRLK